MIYDFTFYNPTRVHFGKNAMEHLSEELNNFGENILFLYGKNSIKKIGLYDKVVAILEGCGKKITARCVFAICGMEKTQSDLVFMPVARRILLLRQHLPIWR